MRFRILLASSFALLTASAGTARAVGTIVASGDTNITTALTNSPQAVDPGNQRFFRNLLGSGTRVLIAGQETESTFITANNNANAYFGSLSGVTSSIDGGEITAADLVGVKLFLSLGRVTPYTQAELTALANFYAAGNNIVATGDATGFPGETFSANQILTATGSGLAIVPNTLDPGFQQASGSNIVAGPLTSGVSSFTYAYVSTVTGGNALVRTQNGSTFVAAAAVPEPATLASVAAVVALGRRRRSR